MDVPVEQYDRGPFRVVAVSGEIDTYSAPSLRSTLASVLTDLEGSGEGSGSIRGVVLDVSGVSFMDSAGLGVLVASQRRARAGGLSVGLVGASAQLQRLLTVTGLGRVLPAFADVEAATR